MKEEIIDYRKLSSQEVYAIKRTIIRQWKNGRKTSEIRRDTGMCINKVRETIRKYKEGGLNALKPKKRGRSKESFMKLSPIERAEIERIIIDKNPNQMKLPFVLWNRKAVKDLIENKYVVKMPIRTVGDYLKRWGFTPQKPVKNSGRQGSKAIKKWLKKDYLEIRRQAKAEKSLIFWMDESDVQNGDALPRGCPPKDKSSALNLDSAEIRVSMVSAISNIGKIYFKTYKESINSELLKDFCDRLIKEQNGRKILLICDGRGVRHTQIFYNWLDKRKDKIEVFYLPSLAQEYIADECLSKV